MQASCPGLQGLRGSPPASPDLVPGILTHSACYRHVGLSFFPVGNPPSFQPQGLCSCSPLCLEPGFFHPSGLSSNVMSSETLPDHSSYKPTPTETPSACPVLFIALSSMWNYFIIYSLIHHLSSSSTWMEAVGGLAWSSVCCVLHSGQDLECSGHSASTHGMGEHTDVYPCNTGWNTVSSLF